MESSQAEQPVVNVPVKNKISWSPITFGIIIFAAGFLVGHSVPTVYYNPEDNFVNSIVGIFVKATPTMTPVPATPTLSPSVCGYQTYPTQGRTPEKDRFLQTYVVVAGDTLLSIAEKELGDVSRINELINLNKGQYPDLSPHSPPMPVGSKLYITPKDFPANTGDLYITEGIIITSEPGYIVLKPNPAPNQGGIDITLRSTTKYMGGIKSIKRGDCVSIVMDYMGNYKHTALVIWPQ